MVSVDDAVVGNTSRPESTRLRALGVAERRAEVMGTVI